MTLKEKFQQWFINDEEDEHYEGMVELVSIEHAKIANEFAIGFAEWIQNNCNEFPKEDQELVLRIYKKEKGL